jgi:aspartate kinase
VTFSRAAVLSRAAEGVIHKEFHLSSADPRIVRSERVRAIARTNYDVADQLANLGMEAIHPRAAAGMRRAGITLRVRNTFAPGDSGARIDGAYRPERPGVDIIAGIPSVTALELFEQDMVGVKGYDAAILRALTRHHVRIVSKVSNANTITHYVEVSPKSLKRVVRDLEKEFPGASVTTAPVSIVAAIGADLAEPGITAKAAAALSGADIEILGMQQVTRGVDIQFIVHRNAYERAVRALHAGLVEGRAAPGVASVAA